jgi:hypothetical protein
MFASFHQMFSGADLTYFFTSADQRTSPEILMAAKMAPDT